MTEENRLCSKKCYLRRLFPLNLRKFLTIILAIDEKLFKNKKWDKIDNRYLKLIWDMRMHSNAFY